MTSALTPREWQTLAALARTDTIKEATITLEISEQTIKNHLVHAFAKLGVTTRDGAYRAVGWLRVPADDEVAAQAGRDRLIFDLCRIRGEAERLIASLRA